MCVCVCIYIYIYIYIYIFKPSTEVNIINSWIVIFNISIIKQKLKFWYSV